MAVSIAADKFIIKKLRREVSPIWGLFFHVFGGKKLFFFLERYIMQLFSADATIFSKLKKEIFTPQNMKKTSSKGSHNQPPIFFSIANRPKISPNHIFCSIEMSLCATSIFVMTLAADVCSFIFSWIYAFPLPIHHGNAWIKSSSNTHHGRCHFHFWRWLLGIDIQK